ncbi:MAG: hypothetical protein WAV95_04750 [Azonexus sp.]
MASNPILQNEISRLGQSQDDRSPAALAPGFAPLDARSPAERVAEARRLAARLRYYGFDPEKADGDWQQFFPADAEQMLSRDDGSVPPHLGLFGAFLDMLAPASGALNELTARHLDFQYRRVLGFEPLPAEPEHAHLTLELKKGTPPLAMTPAHRFTVGKGADGSERLYAPLRESLVGPGRIAALHSIYRAAGGVRFAPLANSADGLGAPLDPAKPQWSAFGHAGLPAAPLGFALASSLLRLREGRREVTLLLDITFEGTPGLTGQRIADCLQAFVSGEKGWLGPCPLTGNLAGGQLKLGFSLAESDAAVVDCNASLHGAAFATNLPVVQLLLRPEAASNYAALAELRLDQARLQVAVEGFRTLTLENDFGALNAKKAFQPFGPQPVKGSRFMIACQEALAKPLTDLKIRLHWQGAPDDFGNWYSNYQNGSTLSNGVAARLVYQEGSGSQTSRELNLMARVDGITTLSPNAPASVLMPLSSEQGLIYSMLSGGSLFSRLLGKRKMRARPVLQQENPAPPAQRSGYVTVALVEDFLHADYRRETLVQARVKRPKVLNEPYTPMVQDISLAYAAQSAVADLRRDDQESFAAALDLQFFHVGAFGVRREHPFLRRELAWVEAKKVKLLPTYPDEGELLIGVDGLAAGACIHLLMQVAEGSADPGLKAQVVNWSVLCDNHWRPVAPEEIALDTSRGLRASGLVGLLLSRSTTTDNTWLPAGPVWLKAAIHQDSAAACQLLAVHANALEVVRVWPAAGPAPAVETLAAGSISKLRTPPAGLKQLLQPYASFAGRAGEDASTLNRRAAERLRHRQRCITPWDYERLLLENFPGIYRVKCIPHASERSWMAAGHVLIVAIPDLRQRELPDPLQPRVDLDTLTRMTELAQAHAAPQVTVGVRNPAYLEVRLDFKVRFRAGHPFDYSRQQLHTAIVQALSPWAFSAGRQVDFGGRIYRSVLLDFIEELPYVDFVTDFRCGLAGAGDLLLNDVPEIVAERPDAILVSAARHVIAEAKD